MNQNYEEPELLAPNVIPAQSSAIATEEDVNLNKVSADVVIEFLEVAFHQILYVCGVYPPTAFMNRKKYGIPVKIAAHPGLTDYILKSLTALRKLIEQNCVSEISLITLQEDKIVTRYIFEIKMLIKSVSLDFSFVELEQSFRSLLIQINSCPQTIQDGKASFEIHINCNASCEVDLNDPDKSDVMWTKVRTNTIQSKILPIHSINDPHVQMQLIIEDCMPS